MQNKSNQVSAEQKSWWTKLHQDLFLMLINPIALILIVPKYIVQREDIWKELTAASLMLEPFGEVVTIFFFTTFIANIVC